MTDEDLLKAKALLLECGFLQELLRDGDSRSFISKRSGKKLLPSNLSAGDMSNGALFRKIASTVSKNGYRVMTDLEEEYARNYGSALLPLKRLLIDPELFNRCGETTQKTIVRNFEDLQSTIEAVKRLDDFRVGAPVFLSDGRLGSVASKTTELWGGVVSIYVYVEDVGIVLYAANGVKLIDLPEMRKALLRSPNLPNDPLLEKYHAGLSEFLMRTNALVMNDS